MNFGNCYLKCLVNPFFESQLGVLLRFTALHLSLSFKQEVMLYWNLLLDYTTAELFVR